MPRLKWLPSICLVSMGMLIPAVRTANGKGPADGLPPKLLGVIEKIEAAHVAGNLEEVWHVLAPAVSGLTDDVATRFDEVLTAKKIPVARELLVQARLKLLKENRTAALPAPLLRERLMILQALQGHVDEPLSEIAEQPLLKEDAPLPENMEEFGQRTREIQKLQGKLRLAASCAKYAAELASKLPATARKKLSDKERDFVTASEGGLAMKVEESERDLRELELETRLHRLRYGVEVLQQGKLTKEKFIAAATTRQDARALQEAVAPPAPPPTRGAPAKGAPARGAPTKTGSGRGGVNVPAPQPVSFKRAELDRPDLADEVRHLAHQAEEAAGPLGEKAEHFFAGLDAWLRGRYGWGPDVWGLAKSSAAVDRPELLRIVSMPEDLPSETKEGDKRRQGQEQTFPDRRHHYIWSWEDRRLASTTINRGKNSDNDGTTEYLRGRSGLDWRSVEHVTTLPPQDLRLVYRIVGFVEYSQALQLLDDFVSEASIAEFEIAEEIVKSRDEFRIRTNLSRPLEKESTLSERSDNPRDDFSRRGLEWMLALARVELGSMLAGFTSHGDPFLAMAPTKHREERVKTRPFGSAAFAEMLLDGLRTHYWSIVGEDVIATYYKTGVPENHLVTYSRRAFVSRQMLKAALQYSGAGSAGENLPEAQRAELKVWDQTFEKLQRILLYCTLQKTSREKIVTSVRHFSAWAPERIAKRESASLSAQRSEDPQKQLLLTIDPSLAACGCQ